MRINKVSLEKAFIALGGQEAKPDRLAAGWVKFCDLPMWAASRSGFTSRIHKLKCFIVLFYILKSSGSKIIKNRKWYFSPKSCSQALTSLLLPFVVSTIKSTTLLSHVILLSLYVISNQFRCSMKSQHTTTYTSPPPLGL